METFSLPIQIRWADLDPNRHLRHSVYYDYGATVRVACFSQLGLTTTKLDELRIGPVLFREEALFKREIKFEDRITVDAEISTARNDYARFSVRHHFYKEDGTLASILNMDVGWIDLDRRKLTLPNDFVQGIMNQIPKSKDFQWIERKRI
jgi:acyl-CoA thioester hydrolase